MANEHRKRQGKKELTEKGRRMREASKANKARFSSEKDAERMRKEKSAEKHCRMQEASRANKEDSWRRRRRHRG